MESGPQNPGQVSSLCAVCQSIARGILDSHFPSQYFCLLWFLVLLEQAVNCSIAGELFFVAVSPGPQTCGCLVNL